MTARRGLRRHGLRGILLWLVPPVAALLGWAGLRAGDAADIGPYGLVSALHPSYFAALALLTVGFVAFLWTDLPRRGALALAYLAVLTALLDGAPFVIEGSSRFPVTYVHIGFADTILRTGETLPLLDARFSWPGFFAMFAYLTEAAGLRDPTTLAVWFPFVVKALWLTAIWVLLRRLLRSAPAAWLGVWLFQVVEWSGQSYFSPQAYGMLVYLVCVAALVVVLDPRREASPVDRGVLAACIAAYAAVVVSHQLSPFMLVAAVAALGVLGLTRARTVWVLLSVLFVVWFSFFTTDYWVGHIGDIIGDAGNLTSNVDDNVGDRVGGSEVHTHVVRVRMLVSLVVCVLASLGVLLAWRRGRLDGRIVVLGAAPFASLGLQSYGGEGLIRAFLFVLPAAAGAAALLFLLPTGRRARGWSRIALLVLLLALVPAAVVAKYGGESYESVGADELRTATWVHDNTDDGDLVVTVAPAGWMRSARVGEVDYAPALDRFETGNLRTIRELLAEGDGRRLVVLSRSQYAYGTYVSGMPDGWESELLRDLSTAADFELVHLDGSSHVFEMTGERP